MSGLNDSEHEVSHERSLFARGVGTLINLIHLKKNTITISGFVVHEVSNVPS